MVKIIYGYARVSTSKQNLEGQIEELKKYGVDKIISEKVSGISSKKSKLKDLLDSLKIKDILVVTRIDRFGRNTIQLLQLIKDLQKKEIDIVILNMGIDTRSSTGKFFLTVMSAFSELERNIIKEKQAAGIESAKKRGLYKGRPKQYTLNSPKIRHAIDLRINTNKTVKEISQITDVSESTLYRRFKEYDETN